jgi:hypothetical protein
MNTFVEFVKTYCGLIVIYNNCSLTLTPSIALKPCLDIFSIIQLYAVFSGEYNIKSRRMHRIIEGVYPIVLIYMQKH